MNDALAYPAAQLFVERVRSSIASFELRDADAPVVADICRRLDGIPLAIELAAGRVDVFGLLGVAARLEDRLGLLTQGRRTAPQRHQTLTATLDWSYNTLSEPEQAVLRRLSVFAGSFSFDSARAVVTDDPVASSDVIEIVAGLVSKSLLNADVATAIGQYRLLDTTRAYARGKLADSGELDHTARRHAGHIQDLIERAGADTMPSPRVAPAARMSAEFRLIDEARAVMDWAFSGGDIRSGVALAIAAIPVWTHLSLNGECCRYAELALASAKAGFAPNDRQEMLLLAALGAALIYTKGPGPEADAAYAEAFEIAEALGDTEYQVRILWGLWSSHFNSGRIRLSLDTARKFRDVALKRDAPVAALIGERSIGMSLFYLGEHAEARRHAETVLQHYVRPNDRSHIVSFQFDPRIVSRTLRSKLLWAQGFPDQAMIEIHGAVEEAMVVGHAMSTALALSQGACAVSLQSGDLAAAERFVDLLLQHTADHALDLWHAWGACFGAMLVIARGDTHEGLARLEGIVHDLPQGAFFMHFAGMHAVWAEALGRVGEIARAQVIIDAALARSDRDEERWYLAEFLRIKGELFRRENAPEALRQAEAQFWRALDCARRQGALSWELRASTSLARLHQDLGRIAEARDVLAPVHGRFQEGFQTADLVAAKTFLDALS